MELKIKCDCGNYHRIVKTISKSEEREIEIIIPPCPNCLQSSYEGGYEGAKDSFLAQKKEDEKIKEEEAKIELEKIPTFEELKEKIPTIKEVKDSMTLQYKALFSHNTMRFDTLIRLGEPLPWIKEVKVKGVDYSTDNKHIIYTICLALITN